MKFGDCFLRRADAVEVGDKVCFAMKSADYVVTEVEITRAGMIRHHYRDGSSSYWPHELLYVYDPDNQ